MRGAPSSSSILVVLCDGLAVQTMLSRSHSLRSMPLVLAKYFGLLFHSTVLPWLNYDARGQMIKRPLRRMTLDKFELVNDQLITIRYESKSCFSS